MAVNNNLVAVSPLTEREWEVLRLVAVGWSDKELAAVLFISRLTVRKHLEHIFAKLNVHSRTAAVARVAYLVVPEAYPPDIAADLAQSPRMAVAG